MNSTLCPEKNCATCLCLNMLILQNWMQRTSTQDLANPNTCWKHSSCVVSIILCTDEQTFTVAISKSLQNYQLYTPAPTMKNAVTKCLYTWLTFRQLLLTSVGELHVTKWWKVHWSCRPQSHDQCKPAIVAWSFFKNSSPSYIRFQARSCLSGGQCFGAQGDWGNQLCYP